jgi:hypothetical protein
VIRTIAAAIVAVVLAGSPAFAHTRASIATDWSSEITEAPNITGIAWKLYPAGEYLEVENRTEQTLVVFGYAGEPYLRIGPDGVETNLNSPATYLNSHRDGDVALPPRADDGAPPDWSHVTDSTRFSWFDHRVHRMAIDGPWNEGASWVVPFEMNGTTYSLEGRLEHDGGPAWWLPFVVALGLTSVALLGARREGTGRLRPAAVVVSCVAVFNLLHVPDEIAALPTSAVDVAFGVGHNILFIGAGLIGCYLVMTKDERSALPLLVASIAVAFHQGFLQLGQLGASQLPTIWPYWTIRLAVAMSVAQLLWVVVLLLPGALGGRLEEPARPSTAHT